MRVFGGAVLWLCLLGQAWALGNQLQSHPSPYLALHGDDPVAWQSWGPDAFETARRENKLIYVSVVSCDAGRKLQKPWHCEGVES